MFVKKSTEGGNAIWNSFKALPGTIVLNYGKEKKIEKKRFGISFEVGSGKIFLCHK